MFPDQPERGVYNNAILERDLAAAARIDAIGELEAAYAAAGVTRFAAWVHESDAPIVPSSSGGDTPSRLDTGDGHAARRPPRARPEVALGSTDWDGYLRSSGCRPASSPKADRSAFHLLIARLDGENVATAMAFDHRRDSGIYNVWTLEHARRRGRHGPHRAPAPRRARARLSDCERAIDRHGRARLCRRGVPYLGRIVEYVPVMLTRRLERRPFGIAGRRSRSPVNATTAPPTRTSAPIRSASA